MSFSSRQKFWRIPQDWRFPKAEDFVKVKISYGLHACESTAWIFPPPRVFDGFSRAWQVTFFQRVLTRDKIERGLRTWGLSEDWGHEDWAEKEDLELRTWVTWCLHQASEVVLFGGWSSCKHDDPGPLRAHARQIVLHWLYNREGTKVILPGFMAVLDMFP